MELKIGDKVRIIKSSEIFSSSKDIFEVIIIMSEHSSFCCRVKAETGWECLMFDWEIEKVSEFKKGQQLEFAFMGEE